MREIVFASGNIGKLKEVREFFEDSDCDILSTKDFGIEKFEVDEDRDTLKGNAEKKALALFDLIKKPVFSDDTGLFVDFLNGEPGVYSARYAGEAADFKANRKKLLCALEGVDKDKRKAYFSSVIAYVDEHRSVFFFDGRIDGYIEEIEKGENGFGYDSIFFFPEKAKTFGEMSNKEKSEKSHRVLALQKFKQFLNSN